MPLDLTGNVLGNMINNAVQSVNPTPTTTSPVAASASAPNFAYSAYITAQTTTFQTGNTYITIDYANPPNIVAYTPLAYIFDQTAGLDGYYQLIPDGYYSSQATVAQQKVWIQVAEQILKYLVANTQVNIPSLPVPATGIDDSTSHACTGTAHSTAESGTIE